MLSKQLQSRGNDVEKNNENLEEDLNKIKLDNESIRTLIHTVIQKADTVDKKM